MAETIKPEHREAARELVCDWRDEWEIPTPDDPDQVECQGDLIRRIADLEARVRREVNEEAIEVVRRVSTVRTVPDFAVEKHGYVLKSEIIEALAHPAIETWNTRADLATPAPATTTREADLLHGFQQGMQYALSCETTVSIPNRLLFRIAAKDCEHILAGMADCTEELPFADWCVVCQSRDLLQNYSGSAATSTAE